MPKVRTGILDTQAERAHKAEFETALCVQSRREATLREALAESLEFVFHAGWHTELMRVAYHDYENSVKPTVAEF